MEKNNKLGFTLLELLVVVLIIALLAGIALPQYNLAVEKARITEAITLVRKIAEMHQMYYLVNGNYLAHDEIDKLDITIPGSKSNEGRLVTKFFSYSPNLCSETCTNAAPYLSAGTRIKSGTNIVQYKIYIYKSSMRIYCTYEPLSTYTPSVEQKKLCDTLNEKGTL